LEHDAGLPRAEAEREAAKIVATLARNRRYLWASLRAALAGYPLLLPQVPDRAVPVDALPLLGLPTVAVRKDKRVLRQGTPNPRGNVHRSMVGEGRCWPARAPAHALEERLLLLVGRRVPLCGERLDDLDRLDVLAGGGLPAAGADRIGGGDVVIGAL
jgi:hypothetical protein